MTSSFGRGASIVAALWLAACGASAPEAAQVRASKVEAAGYRESEVVFLKKPRPAELYLATGRGYTVKQQADGTFPDTVDGPKGPLAVESLRRAYFIVAAGLLAEGQEADRLLDQGLKAFEWGFQQAGDQGSFPNERGGTTKKQNSLHPKAVYIEAAARTLLLLQQSDVDATTRRRIEALIPALHKSARWMAESQDTVIYFKRNRNTNQLMVVATGLQETAIVTGDQALAAKAQALMEEVLARQTDDGAFPEKGGFDSGYQGVSLELLGRYFATLKPSPWRARVEAALRKGTDRLVTAIDPATGQINDSANTRTVACGAPVDEDDPKAKPVLRSSLRIHYLGHLLNDEARLSPLAERVSEQGQVFTHDDKCPAEKRALAGDKGGE